MALAFYSQRCQKLLGSSWLLRFIRNFSQEARPLTDLTKGKPPWKWELAEEKAFKELKESLVTAPVLKMPDFDKSFVLTTDASAVAVGAILEQDFGQGLLCQIL